MSGFVGCLPFDNRLGEVTLDQLEEAIRLPPIEPDDGGDVLLLLGAEVEDGTRDLAVDIARIEHQDAIGPLGVSFLRAVEKPELAGHGAGVEEVAADIDHHVHGAGLDQLLPHLGLVPPGAGGLRRHDDAGPAGLVQVAVEIGEPQVVGIGDLLRLVHSGQAERQAFVALDLLGVHFVHVERRIGHDEVALAGQFVRVLVVGDGFVSGPNGALQAMNGEVDLGQLRGGLVLLVAVERDPLHRVLAFVLDEVARLHKHAARAAGGVEDDSRGRAR